MFFISHNHKSQKGSILILAVWTLSLLTLFSVHIGLKVRQRITLLSRIEHRSQLQYLASSGIKKAIAALITDLQRNNFIYTAEAKGFRHNNPGMFKNIYIAQEGHFDVYYDYYDPQNPTTQRYYGVMDEESKLNINTANREELQRLFFQLVTIDEDDALELAEAVVDWREVGQSQTVGFYSDDYYYNLKNPYRPKDADFEVLDELLLVKGFNQERLDRLRPYITIYGEGMVNINTASDIVLLSLGLDTDVVEKILTVRRGEDQKDNTSDDYIFSQMHDVATEVRSFTDLDVGQIKQIDSLSSQKKIKATSLYYSMTSEGQLNGSNEKMIIQCVYNVWENSVQYWRQK